jgi:hypothetical protein
LTRTVARCTVGIMRGAIEAVRDTLIGTVMLVGGLMFFVACIYVGAFLNVEIWRWLASLI